MAVNSSQAAKWVQHYITLHFGSFYFTDPPATDEGIWPKQLHSNTLEHLSLALKQNAKMIHALCVYLFI